MSHHTHLRGPEAPPREGNLEEIGAVLCAIVRLTANDGGLEEEETRAVYSLACIALAEWRLLDAATNVPRLSK